MMANEQDLTDLVPHLRTVHFTLLLACILTLLPTMLGRRGEVTEAHRQLQKIQAMRNSWDRWTQEFSFDQLAWLRTLGVHWLAPTSEHAYIDSATLTQAGIRHSPGTVLGVRLRGVPLYFHLDVKDRSTEFILAVPSGELNVSDVFPLEISFPSNDSSSRSFTSLDDFRAVWDSAGMPKVTFLHRVSSIAYLVVDKAIRSDLPMRPVTQRERGLGAQEFHTSRSGGCPGPGLELESIRAHTGNTEFNAIFCADVEPGRLVIPADLRTARVPTDLRQWLIKKFDVDGAGGDFSKMFPELSKVTPIIETLDVDTIDQILKAELDRQGDRVQFLGVSLPEPLMASWGMIIVLATQTYFWLHLRAFKRRVSSSTPVPFASPHRPVSRHAWIGLYNDWWASFVMIVTVCSLPTLVVTWAGFVSSWPWWVSVVVALIVLVLAWDSGRLLGFRPVWVFVLQSLPIIVLSYVQYARYFSGYL